MSPEALLANTEEEHAAVGTKTDVYSFGLLLWELITQQNVFGRIFR